LEDLLKSDALISEPSPILDRIYALKRTPLLTLEDTKMGTSAQELLSSKSQLLEISKEFKDDEIVVLGSRAIAQITKLLDGDRRKEDELIKQQEQVDSKEKPRISPGEADQGHKRKS
jgi:hypothetical protein